MDSYVPSALFLYVHETEKLIDQIIENPFGVQITSVKLKEFMERPEHFLQNFDHAVVAGPLEAIKEILMLAKDHAFSLGIIPITGQKDLINGYGLPKQMNEALEIALRKDAQVMDLILCNKKVLLFKATVGRLPLLDSTENINRALIIKSAIQRCVGIKLLPFQFRTGTDGKTIKTAASGCMIIQRHERTLASKLIAHDNSLTDGMVSMVVTAPISILDYLSFLFKTFLNLGKPQKIPRTIGYIKSSQVVIDTETPLEASIDGEKVTQTPLHCETFAQAVRINVGENLRESIKKEGSVTERIEIENLPTGKELSKASSKRIPFFSYASEERFKDLFISLRKDAKITTSYLVLIMLSTMLATVGLYQSSSAVVIGAMLLAPLMAPIVSLSMGLLRGDTKLLKNSMVTIAVGVAIALLAAMLISLLFPHKPLTMEMQARLNPSLLDLAVAIVAGVAGAYTKSNKEILQSLAGVSIAVALVPPLAVAGIGLGMRDPDFFGQAFLLFSTNLIGISLAATITFRVLGYSPVVRSKQGFAIVALTLLAITIPLYLSYRNIVETTVLEKNWQYERFLINNKYLIVQKADLLKQRGKKLLLVKVMVREALTRRDLNQLRRKIESHLTDTTDIRVQIIYIP